MYFIAVIKPQIAATKTGKCYRNACSCLTFNGYILSLIAEKPNHLLEYNMGNDFCLEDMTAIVNFTINCSPTRSAAPLPMVLWFFRIGEELNELETNLSDILVVRNNRSTLSFGSTSLLNLSRLLVGNNNHENQNVTVEFACILTNSAGNDTSTIRISQCCECFYHIK